MEWSNEKSLEFLEMYESATLIWNPKHPQHKDRNAVYDAWKNIESKLNIPLKELKKKKKDTLLATYRKLSKKAKASKGSGTGAGEVFHPVWFAYDIMERFLHGVYMPRTTIHSEEFDNKENEEYLDDPNDNDDETVGNTEGNFGVGEASSSSETVAIDEESTTPVTEKAAFKTPTGRINKRKRKASQIEHVQNQMDETFKILKTVTEKSSKPDNSQKDQCALYTELLCAKLRALDENNREVAMFEIDNLLFRIKMQHKRNSVSQQQYTPLSNVLPVFNENSSHSLHSYYSNIHQRPSTQNNHQQYYPGSFEVTPHQQSSAEHVINKHHSYYQLSTEYESPSMSSQVSDDTPSPALSVCSHPSPSYTPPIDTLTLERSSQSTEETRSYTN